MNKRGVFSPFVFYPYLGYTATHMEKRICLFSVKNIILSLVIVWAFYGLFSIRDFLVLLMLSFVIAVLMDAPINALSRKHIPRPFVAFFLYLFILSLFFGSFVLFLPVVIQEVGKLSTSYPEIFNSLRFLNHFSSFQNAKDFLVSFDRESLRSLFDVFIGMFGGLANLVITIVIAFYLNMKSHAMEKVIEFITPGKYESFILAHWRSFRHKMESWFHGQLILALLVFFFTLLGLSILGVPYAFLLSVLAGLFGLIPYGILFAILPALILAFNMGGLKLALFVIVLYVVIQQITDYLIQPLISKRMTGVPPVAVIISAVASTKLFGIVGLILAVPIALFVMELFTAWEERDKSLKKGLSR